MFRTFLLLLSSLCRFFFFFFKQKTAYEMRISDWSSDVCSSDLALAAACGLDFGLGSNDARRARIGFLHSLCQRQPGGERPRPDGLTGRRRGADKGRILRLCGGGRTIDGGHKRRERRAGKYLFPEKETPDDSREWRCTPACTYLARKEMRRRKVHNR